MNDVMRLAMEQAARSFGGHDGMFNGAGFALAMQRISGVAQLLDGIMVRAMLAGRADVEVLPGGAHYRIK